MQSMNQGEINKNQRPYCSPYFCGPNVHIYVLKLSVKAGQHTLMAEDIGMT